MGHLKPEVEKYEFGGGAKSTGLILMVVGGILAAVGIFLNMEFPTRIFTSLLHNSFFFVAIGFAAMFFVTSQTVAYNGWFVLVRRIHEAMGTSVLVGVPIFALALILGYHNIYEWAHDGITDPNSANYDALIDHKSWFLNPKIFFIFSAVYLALWWICTYLVRKNSADHDNNPGLEPYVQSKKLSMIFLVVFGVSSSTAIWHWFMSIDPHWFSTLYGWYCFISIFVASMAASTLIALYLKNMGLLKFVTDEHIHDLGKYVFAFSVAWAYLWFSQFMLIWYSHIPEETMYFRDRFDHYPMVFFANFIINFLTPFFVLLTAGAKRNRVALIFVCTMVIFGHWLDFYLMATPGAIKHSHIMVEGQQIFNFGIGPLEIGLGLFFAGLFIFVTFQRLAKLSLVPVNHPFVKESMVHHV